MAQKEKEEARARKEEEKRLAKEEKRKSRGEAVVGGTHAEDTETADNGVERHRSVIARLKNRFSKSGAPGEATKDTTDKTVVTEPTTAAAATTPATPVKSGTVAAAAAASDEKAKDADGNEIDNGLSRDDTPPPMPISPVTIRETEPKPRASSEASDSKWKPVSVPTTAAADGIILGGGAPAIAVEDESDDTPVRPPFEQKPSLSGLRSDNAETSGSHMPDLERHISQIPESDDDDEDWNDERKADLGDDHAHVVANRVATAPVTEDPAATAAAPLPTSAMTDETLARLDEQRAEPPATTATATTTTTEPVVAATSTTAASPTSEDPEKKEKGVRGFLNKLRHRRGDSDTSTTVPATSTKSSTDASAIPEAAGARTIPPVDVGPRFTEADSSDDEDRRGRKGTRGSAKLQKKMGFGNSRTTNTTTTTTTTTTGEEPGRDSTATTGSGDNETFEEARDTFDESLAPPPAFGGQAKAPEGGSPSRGTKFQEEL